MNIKKEQRQTRAWEREVIRDKRTPEQQLCLVKTRRGESKKERARLERLIAQIEKKDKGNK